MDTTAHPSTTKRSPYFIGATLMVISVFSFAASTLVARQLTLMGANPWGVLTARGIVGLLLTAVVLGHRGNYHPLRVFTRPLLIARGLLGAFGLGFFYVGIAEVGAGMATLLTNTYVLFAIPISAIALKERPAPQQLIWIGIAFVAVAVLVIAGMEGSHPSEATLSSHLLVLIGAIMASFTVVIIRHLHGKESTATIYSAQCIYSIFLSVPILLMSSLGALSPVIITLMIISGILAGIAQLTMTEAFKHLPVAVGGGTQLALPAITAIGAWFIFGEVLTPIQIAAAAVILMACGLATTRK